MGLEWTNPQWELPRLLGPNEVALLVFLAGATLAEARSMDRLDGLRRGKSACSGIVGTGVVMGSRGMSGRFVERPEPRKTSLYTTKSVVAATAE